MAVFHFYAKLQVLIAPKLVVQIIGIPSSNQLSPHAELWFWIWILLFC